MNVFESNLRWLAVAVLSVGCTLAAAVRPVSAGPVNDTAAPPAPPAGQPAATTRPPDQIIAEMDRTGIEIAKAMPDYGALFDDARRAELAPRALPPMRRMAGLTDELGQAAPELQPNLMRVKQELSGAMAILGDAAARQSLEKQALPGNRNRDEAAAAQAWLFAAAWAKAMKEPPAQEKILADFTALGKANAPNEMLAQVASLLCDYPATPALGQQAEDMLMNDLTSPMARQIKTKILNRRRLNALEGKPLIIEGKTTDGKPFSSDAWKGKVVLVDFWATWCAPCMAELPKMKELYADYHGKGLEIVGVSSDRGEVDDFRKFLADNKDMPWPQLIDPAAALAEDPHPLLPKFGIETIPTMFIIDKRGTCRSIKAHENVEELVRKLTAE